jgi:enoyl-CoA hydratase/carnithine racemase
MDLGEFYLPEDSLKLGLVDAVMPLDEILPGAIEKVKAIGSYPEIAFATIKGNRVEPIEKEIRANLVERERMLLSAFFSTPSLELIKKATETF